MIDHLKAGMPSDAYDWAKRCFSAGGFQITGEKPESTSWCLCTLGKFCVLHLPKKWGSA